MTPSKPRFTLVPPGALLAVARVLTLGAARHGDEGWRRRLPEEYADALYRHLEAWRSGESVDPDDGEPHLAHAAADALILLALTVAREARIPRLQPEAVDAEAPTVPDLDLHSDFDRRVP